MKIKLVFSLLLCIALLYGCAPSRAQHKHIWNTINSKTDVRGYTVKYLLEEFGFPYSKAKIQIDGKRCEIWTYRTNLEKKYKLIMRAGKTRYLKITVRDGSVIDFKYE